MRVLLLLVLGMGMARGDLAGVGKLIFFDEGLSDPVGVSCASCHVGGKAFTDGRAVSQGVKEGRRNAPSLMYAALIPPLAYEDVFLPDGSEVYAWEGGMFHDGRAADLFAQVRHPFFDGTEMNLKDEGELARRLRGAAYAGELRKLTGEKWDEDGVVNYYAFRTLVEFLKEPLFRPFSAPIDDYLAGKEEALREDQVRGLAVFQGAGGCADCHRLEMTEFGGPLLSDFGYDNLGAPSRGEKDPGLGAVKGAEERGKFRSPSLRNVALTGPYLHNGSMKTLQEVMEFYNKRDVEPKRWGATDYPDTVNRDDFGDLGLSEQEVADLVALMEAFTDRTLLEMKEGDVLPKALPETPSTEKMKLFFPDWTHRLDPDFPGG
ncbi:MAG: cytochrome-c peroxidase [Verrucomicrobiaceae bacterium]